MKKRLISIFMMLMVTLTSMPIATFANVSTNVNVATDADKSKTKTDAISEWSQIDTIQGARVTTINGASIQLEKPDNIEAVDSKDNLAQEVTPAALNQPIVTIDTINEKQPGDKLVISGVTTINEVIIQVETPNKTNLYVNTVKSNNGRFTDNIQLPIDSMLGTYKVKVGQGANYTEAEFVVKKVSEVVGKAALNAKIKEAESINRTLYTESSYNNLQIVLTAAKNTSMREDVTQADVISSKDNLEQAISKLEIITAEMVAKSITTVSVLSVEDARVTVPTVPEGFTISIESTTPAGLVARDGIVTRQINVTNEVVLVFKVTKISDGSVAYTNAIKLLIQGNILTIDDIKYVRQGDNLIFRGNTSFNKLIIMIFETQNGVRKTTPLHIVTNVTIENGRYSGKVVIPSMWPDNEYVVIVGKPGEKLELGSVQKKFSIVSSILGIDKTTLNAKISQIEKLDATLYTYDTFNSLLSALDKAKKVISNLNATQLEVDDSIAALENALNALVTKAPEIIIDPITGMQPGDTFEIKGKISGKASSNEVIINIKDPNGVDIFVNTVRYDGEFRQTVTLARNSLPGTYKVSIGQGKLIGRTTFEVTQVSVVVNKTVLNATITRAEKLDTTAYTKESVTELVEAINAAKDINRNEDATQIQIDEVNAKLEKALEHLQIITIDMVAGAVTTVSISMEDDVRLLIPKIPEGYTISIHNATSPSLISEVGIITVPEVDTEVEVVFKVTKVSDGTVKFTKPILVKIPGRSITIDNIDYVVSGQTLTVKGKTNYDKILIALFETKGGKRLSTPLHIFTNVVKEMKDGSILYSTNITINTTWLEGEYIIIVGKQGSKINQYASIQKFRIVKSDPNKEYLETLIKQIESSTREYTEESYSAVRIDLDSALSKGKLAIKGTKEKIQAAIDELKEIIKRLVRKPTDPTNPTDPTDPTNPTNPTTPTTPTTPEDKKKEITLTDGNLGKDTDMIYDEINKNIKIILSESNIKNLIDAQNKESKGTKKVTLELPSNEVLTSYNVVIPINLLKYENRSIDLEVRSKLASLSIASGKKELIKEGKESNISIGTIEKEKLKEGLKEIVGRRPILDISMTVDGKKQVLENHSSMLSVSIPYEATKEELSNTEAIVVYAIDKDGNGSIVPGARYDTQTKTVNFIATKLGNFAVGYRTFNFKDITKNASVKKSSEILTSKGIMYEQAKDIFVPELKLSKGNFVIALVKTLQLDAEINYPENKPYRELEIAKYLKLMNDVKGINGTITKAEMLIFVEKAMNASGKKLVAGNVDDLKKYSDFKQLSQEMKVSMAALLKNGIIVQGGKYLDPNKIMTKADMVEILYKLYK